VPLIDRLSPLSYDPGVTPQDGGLPGLPVLKQVMGSLDLFGLVAVVGALAVSAVVWAWGQHSGSHQAEANGKKGCVISAGCALLLGAANGIVSFFSVMGSRVK
jgi:Family of unknown function (DUF6112)